MDGERPVAVVTGAARRVGRKVAERLAAEGYRVAVHYRSSAEEARQLVQAILQRFGTEATALQADLADPGAGPNLIDAVVERWGRVDVLVTCASEWKPVPIEEADGRALERFWRSNVLASYSPAWRAGLWMVRQPEGGCIVLVGDWAISRPYPDFAPYLIAKGAIPAMARTLAVEFGRRNPRVRVNAALPGPILLPEGLAPDEAERVKNATLVKTIGSPDDLADLVLFFARHPFVTGTAVPIDGGRTIYCPGDVSGELG